MTADGSAERGAAAIVVLALAAVVGAVGLLTVAVTRVLTVRHEVAAAADLAALAAVDGRCAAGERVAAANAVEVVSCVAEDGTVRVEVVRHVRWLGVASAVRSTALAGDACPEGPDPEQ